MKDTFDWETYHAGYSVLGASEVAVTTGTATATGTSVGMRALCQNSIAGDY